jgi:serine/threonine protein kinase
LPLEKSKSAWNRQSESKKPKYCLELRRIVSDAEGYLYDYDPNFDFDNRDVHVSKHDSSNRIKEYKIKEYYVEVDQKEIDEEKKGFNDMIRTPRAKPVLLESAMDLLNVNQKWSANITRQRINTDYNLTKVDKGKKEPAKMRKRAPYKLIEICKENGYDISIDDFDDDHEIIGAGTFGEVYIVNWKLNSCKYALKILNKSKVKNYGYERHIMREKDIMNMLNHPNIVRLEHYFHDSDNWYFLFELWEVGDLATFIFDHKILNTKVTREFTMEIICALEELRKKNIVHRDLKPQNILLDNTYHIKLADFGAAKIIDPDEVSKEISSKNFNDDSSDDDSVTDSSDMSENDDSEEIARAVMLCRENTQVGSPLYISPEMLKYQIACFGSDLWALGWIIYQCITGSVPFTGRNKFEVEDKINNCEYSFPKGFNKHAKDLIQKLLRPNPSERLGAGGEDSENSIQSLKKHPFFKGKSFKKCQRRIPAIKSLRIWSSKTLKNLVTIKTMTTLEEQTDNPTPDSVRSMCFETNVTKADSHDLSDPPSKTSPYNSTEKGVKLKDPSRRKMRFNKSVVTAR